MTFSRAVLDIDAAETADRLAAALREAVGALGRRGAVLGLSGGVDSSVCAALAARGLGREHVLGVLMPEVESASESVALARELAAQLGIETVVEDITEVLRAAGCYERRDEAIRTAVPEYGDGWRAKLVLPSVVAGDGFRLATVVAESPGGERIERRLGAAAYRTIVAATSFKQRTRKMVEYFHADRLDYAVLGTPNRLEFDQGFFVKNGDGAADVKPIAHLYKSQVYALAEALGLPAGVRARAPTTDTYALEQTQDEFFFSVPLETLDLCLYAVDAGVPAAEVAAAAGLDADAVERIFRDIEQKRRAAAYLHAPPALLERVVPDGPG